jgi:hypothetical protein
MIAYRFSRTCVGSRDKSGSAPYLRLDGERLLAGPEERELARYDHRLWESQGNWYTILEIETPVRLAFQTDGQTRVDPYGPCDALMLVEGDIYADREDKRFVARFDESARSWRVYGNPKTCGTIVLMPVRVRRGAHASSWWPVPPRPERPVAVTVRQPQ